MKILVLTRFENNTGGDNAFLFIVAPMLFPSHGEDSSIDLWLAYDEASADRAKRAAQKWHSMLAENNCQGQVILNLSTGKSAASASKLMTYSKKDTQVYDNDDTLSPLNWQKYRPQIAENDLFVMAGWAHLQSSKSITFFEKQLSIKPEQTRFLLCSPPVMPINSNGIVTGKQGDGGLVSKGFEVSCMQFGINEPAGLVVPHNINREAMLSQQTRDLWVSQAAQQTDGKVTLSNDSSPSAQSDEVAVIYCSKDLPNQYAHDWLSMITKEYAGQLQQLPVLLIGSDSDNNQAWLDTLAEFNLSNVHLLQRTASSAILMRALRDAKYSMATGSFSILEAQYLGINHCHYLAPDHMLTLQQQLAEHQDTPQAISAAFDRGSLALESVNMLTTKIGITSQAKALVLSCQQFLLTLSDDDLELAEQLLAIQLRAFNLIVRTELIKIDMLDHHHALPRHEPARVVEVKDEEDKSIDKNEIDLNGIIFG